MGDILQKRSTATKQVFFWVDVWPVTGPLILPDFCNIGICHCTPGISGLSKKKTQGGFLGHANMSLSPKSPQIFSVDEFSSCLLVKSLLLLDTHPSRPFVGITSLTLSHPFNKHIGKTGSNLSKQPYRPSQASFVAAQGNDRPSLPCMTTLQPPKPGRLAAFFDLRNSFFGGNPPVRLSWFKSDFCGVQCFAGWISGFSTYIIVFV